MTRVAVKVAEKQVENTSVVTKPTCGIVMPISAIDGCSENHWSDVKTILQEAIASAGYEADIVSNAEDISVIQTRIVQNLYDKDIIVCDVSCKNANVMFELGMRLAFDKPTIIVIDDKTGFPFDTSPIEHLVYPRDLRYSKIIEFKNKLKDKIQGTIKKAQEDPSYSPFLKSFGKIKVATIEHKEGSINDVVLQRLDDMQQAIVRLQRPIRDIEFRRTQEDDNLRNERINALVRNGIDKYVEDTGIPESILYENRHNERLELQEYLERDRFLCQLCGRESRMQKAIDDNLRPF